MRASACRGWQVAVGLGIWMTQRGSPWRPAPRCLLPKVPGPMHPSRLRSRAYAFAAALAALAALSAAPNGAPLERRVRFTTHEGSWLSFDLSRDGRWIVMDLLGQVWRLPADGGTARALTDAVRDTTELLDPSFSPDGKSILVHGEYRGLPGTFVIDSAGSVRRVTPDALRRNSEIVPNSAAWSPDGRAVALARQDSTGSFAVYERDLVSGQERRLPTSGLGAGDVDAPVYSAGGMEILFDVISRDATTYPPAGRIWRVAREGGAAQPFSPAGISALKAAPSPDGRRVAYFVLDSASRAQVWVQGVGDTVATQLTSDRDVAATRIRWYPDGAAFAYIESGRIWRFDVTARTRREIPFSATVDFMRRTPDLPAARFPRPGDEVRPRLLTGFSISPDGRQLAIMTLNGLWLAATEPGAAARRIASVHPEALRLTTWSPDGKMIAWGSGFRDEADLYLTSTATGATHRVSALPGVEAGPSFAPDGRSVVFTHIATDSAGRQSFNLRVAPVQTSAATSIGETRLWGGPGAPWAEGMVQWRPSGDALLVVGSPGNQSARPARLRFPDGAADRVLRGLPADASWVRWLGNDTLVFVRRLQAWRAPVDVAAGVIGAPTLLTNDLAIELETSRSGDVAFRSDDGLRVWSAARGVRKLGFPVSFRMPESPPTLVTNVRVFDGTVGAVSVPRDVLLERGRITRIATTGTIRPPVGTDTLDAAGRTAIPGLIDLHGHFNTPAQFRGQLYYGVTTARLAGAYDELASGTWPGPRVVAGRMQVNPGEAMPWRYADWNYPIPLGSDEAYFDRVMRLAADSGSQLIKMHTYADFAGQARVVAAAHARGTRVTGHCGYPLALVAAGIDSKEHLGWQCSVHDVGTWYDDLVQLHVHAGLPVVPTRALFTNTHRLQGTPEPTPPEVAELFGPTETAQVARSLNWLSRITPGSARDLDHQTDALRKLYRAGVVIGAGTDFERPGGIQYELEALVEAGMTPVDALKAATSNAARIIGARDLGRIAPGFIGDLVLLDGDPIADIRNARKVWAVVKDGRIVDRKALVAPGWNAVPASR